MPRSHKITEVHGLNRCDVATVRFVPDFSEFIVRLARNGLRVDGVSYHTDDEDDARNSAGAMLVNFNRSSPCHK